MGIRDDRLWGWGNLVRIFFESGIFFFDLFLVFLTFCASYLLVGNFWTAELTISTNVIVGFGHHAKVLFFILPVSLLLFGMNETLTKVLQNATKDVKSDTYVFSKDDGYPFGSIRTL